MNKIIYILFIFLHTVCSGQGIDSLISLVPKIQKGESDAVRINANRQFLEGFEKVLRESPVNRTYDSLKNVSVVSSEDGRLKIYTWVLPHFDGNNYEYFGFLQYREGNMTDSVVLLPLIDSTSVIVKPESEKLSPGKWFGAVYYGIKETSKKDITYYTLFGWKGKNQNETQKVIDVLFFNKNKPRFGATIFKSGSVYKSRMIFTFSSLSTMKLNFDRNYNGIVLDHLAKRDAVVTGPDGSYDAYKWKKGKWQLYHDVDIRTKWEPKEQLPEPPVEK